jgi:hypothetical protein
VSEILDVAIGLVLVWFLLSVAVSGINEAFNWLTRMRAKQLWRSLAGIVDSKVKPQARLRDLLWRIPVGVSDYRPEVRPDDPAADKAALSERRAKAASVPKADEVPEETKVFLQRLRDRLARSLDDTAASGWRTRLSHIPGELLSDALVGLAEETITRTSLLAAASRLGVKVPYTYWVNLPASGDVSKDAAFVRPTEVPEARWTEVVDEAKRLVTIEDLESIVAGNKQLATALRRVRLAAGGANDLMLGARKAIEDWFNAEMDGLSRFFRRQNRKLAALIALVVVFLVQADSFRLLDDLWHDKDLRSALSTNAAQVVDADLQVRDPASFLALCREVAGVGDAAADTSTTEPPTTEAPTTSGGTDAAEDEQDALEEAQARLQCAADLVRGTRRYRFVEPAAIWTEVRDENTEGTWEAGDPGSWIWHRVPGRLVTAAALMFGAGFWYDALGRLVGLKGKLKGGAGGG